MERMGRNVPWKLLHQLLVQLMQQQMINFHDMSKFCCGFAGPHHVYEARENPLMQKQVLGFHNVSAQVVLHDAWIITTTTARPT